MQPSAGQDLPHTRARAVHWLATAGALAGLLAAALLMPAGAQATGDPEPADAGTGDAPDPERADYPLDCGPWGTDVISRHATDFDGDGRRETVAVVRCSSGIGTPPSGVYVLAARRDGTVRIAETLVDPGEQLSVSDFRVDEGSISAKLHGYSSESVPRCCPDQERDVSWQWRQGEFALRAAPHTAPV
ncbi:hypothetical protein QNO07_08915 [Streptomyces sp. 549]|uniref:hypothetical protein n=1 Tax=Streptomyces sp. 549 TaxID=3049076 RepID=UPI0024C3FC6B|nr:hypothetical protein [Streptomyces sp. 549]MDK1473538.1 hypothetical protein [Streptomyces sp. 549]